MKLIDIFINAFIILQTFLTLDKFTPFTTTVNDTVLTFVNLDAVTIQPNQGTYTFNNIELVEGVQI
jgi:hypothetical protein